ncbi:MAG: hypothetical protein ACI8WB_002967 [Phenylobacterium sp.]|jgi:hypothetical protein
MFQSGSTNHAKSDQITYYHTSLPIHHRLFCPIITKPKENSIDYPGSTLQLLLSYRQQSGLDSLLNTDYTHGLQLHQGVDAEAGVEGASTSTLFRHFPEHQDSYKVDLTSTISFSSFDFSPYLNTTGFTVITLEKNAQYIKFHLIFDSEQAIAKPYITRQPGENFTLAGFDTFFNIDVYSATPHTYQWFFQASLADPKQPITAATSRSVNINQVGAQDVGFYSVEVTNDNGTVSSIASYLDVFAAPTITSQPQDMVVSLGSPLILRLSSPQSPQGNVKWYRNGIFMGQAYSVRIYNGVEDFTITMATVTIVAW